MSPVLFLIGLTLTLAFASFGLYGYQRLTNEGAIVRRRVMPASEGMALRSSTSILRDRSGRLPFVDRLPLSAESHEVMARDLERAGQQLRVSEYLTLRMGFAFVFAFLAFLVMQSFGAPAWLGLVASLSFMVVGWLVPRYYIHRARERRQQKIQQQIPHALTAMTKSLRAGSGLFQSLAFAAEEVPAPFGDELQRTLDDLRLGVEPEDAFARLAERVGSVDLDIVATAIVIQRTVGGNLSEVLKNVNETIYERVKIQREVAVLTASQRLMGNLVAGLPVLVALMFIVVNPDLGRLLTQTTVGQIALAVGIGFELVGLYLIRRLGVVEV